MSLKPAIGKRWIEKFWQDAYPRDYVVMDGLQFKPPRYYDKWMEKHHPDIMFDVRFKRDKEAKILEETKLAMKEKIHAARVELYQQRGKV